MSGVERRTRRPQRPVVSVLSLLMMTLASVASGQEKPTLRAGVASVVITPTESMWMAGYASRTRPSSGTVHDLHAKALALEDAAGHRILLVSADLLGITRGITAAVTAALRNQPEHGPAVILATSHTHTGPVLRDHLAVAYGLTEAAKARVGAYTDWLQERLIEVGRKALADLAPARLSWGNGKATFAVNRRNNPEARVPELRAKSALAGPTDHGVPVLAVRAPDGALRAIVFGYACHATVLSSYRFCGDYPGFAQLELEAAYPGAQAMFFAGCGADQNPLPRRSLDLAERYGRELATAVRAVLTAEMRPIHGALASAEREIELPFDTLPEAADLERRLQEKSVYERRRATRLLDTIRREGALPAAYPFPITACRLGDGPTLIALGGEVVVDYALRLRRDLPAPLWVAAYCNDVMGYIPSQRVWQEGGYEGGGAAVYYGLPARWSSDVEQRVVAGVRAVVAELGRKNRAK